MRVEQKHAHHLEQELCLLRCLLSQLVFELQPFLLHQRHEDTDSFHLFLGQFLARVKGFLVTGDHLHLLRFAPFEYEHLLLLPQNVMDLDLRDFEGAGLLRSVLFAAHVEQLLEVVDILLGVEFSEQRDQALQRIPPLGEASERVVEVLLDGKVMEPRLSLDCDVVL